MISGALGLKAVGGPGGDRGSAREAANVISNPPADPGEVTTAPAANKATWRVRPEWPLLGLYIKQQVALDSGALSVRRQAVAVYRYQVVCVGFWRGKVKRWNTTFHQSSSGNTTPLKNAMQAVGWKNAGDVTGACSGGVASIAVYNSTGGAPISNAIYFDWKTPTTWIPYTGTAWAAVDPDTPLDASGESAAVVIGHMGALSKSGKPVTVRKYLHAIPSRTATNYSDPDIDTTTRAAILAQFTTLVGLANPAGVQPASSEVSQYYLNHQRVRGRRRTKAQLQANAYSGGVLLGAGATGAGAAPFPGQ